MALRLKELRCAQGRTIREMGAVLHKTHATYQRYEAGRIPITVDDLVKLARYFKVSLNDLWREDEDEEEAVYV